ncbi:MAG: type II toxin-antitoxin system HipA family toxin [Planctomycetota bacterium]
MGRRSRRQTLYLSMNGQPVATLERRPPGRLRLQYDPDWLDRQGSVPLSLSLPLAEEPRSDEAVESFFENLLPDSADLRTRLQRAVGADSSRAFDLLAQVGADCVGALQIRPVQGFGDVRSIDAEPWSDADVARHLSDLRSGGTVPGAAPRPFRISIAGAQEKTGLLRHDGGWCLPRGTTPTTHIFKTPIGMTPQGIDLSTSVDNEHLCSLLVAAFDLKVAPNEIAEFEEHRVLVVERFDRRLATDESWWIRLPQEDLCQATGTPPARKYQSDGGPGIPEILRLLASARDPLEERTRFLRTQVVFWLLAAIDGHAKNFSLFLEPGGSFRRTPLYDVLSAHPAISAGTLHEREAHMAMALVGKNRHYRWREMHYRHWLSTASRGGLTEESAKEAVASVCERAPEAVAEVEESVRGSKLIAEVVEPILEGVTAAAERLEREIE